MKRIIEYGLIKTQDPTELVKMINTHISNGWQPIGGVSTQKGMSSFYIYYIQGIVKYEDQ